MGDPLSVKVQTVNGCEIIAFTGRIDAASSKIAEDAIHDLLVSGKQHLILDGSGLDYISSSGLRVILAALKELKKTGGDFKLAALKPAIREVITMTGFHRIFEVYDDVDTAIKHFSKTG